MERDDLDEIGDQLNGVRLARQRDAEAYAAVLERAIATFDDDPVAAGEVFDLAELFDELWPEYESLGRTEDALVAADAAVAAGLRSEPDPRCLRAEILMRAGRLAEAEPIWAAVRADTPDDVWLYNNAGLEYGAAGAHETAVAWLTDGMRLALDTGDAHRLVDQLADLRRASLAGARPAGGRPAAAGRRVPRGAPTRGGGPSCNRGRRTAQGSPATRAGVRHDCAPTGRTGDRVGVAARRRLREWAQGLAGTGRQRSDQRPRRPALS